MVKFELLSQNLIVIMNHAIQNINLVKYLAYAEKDPIALSPVAVPEDLLFQNLFPQPFDDEAETEDSSQLRIYYGDADLQVHNDGVIVIFDIIVAKKLWLCRNNDIPVVRAYEMMAELARIFDKKPIETVGKLEFVNFRHMFVNSKFDGIRLFAKMTTFNG